VVTVVLALAVVLVARTLVLLAALVVLVAGLAAGVTEAYFGRSGDGLPKYPP